MRLWDLDLERRKNSDRNDIEWEAWHIKRVLLLVDRSNDVTVRVTAPDAKEMWCEFSQGWDSPNLPKPCTTIP